MKIKLILKKLLKWNESSNPSKIVLAREFANNGNLIKAIEICHKLNSSDQPNSEVLELIGYIYQQQSQYDLAIEYCKKSQALNLNSWLASFVLALAYQAKNDHANCLISIKKAYDLSPEHDETVLLYFTTVAKQAGADKLIHEFKSRFLSGLRISPQLVKLYVKFLFEFNIEIEPDHTLFEKIGEYRKFEVISVEDWAKSNSSVIFRPCGLSTPISIKDPLIFDSNGVNELQKEDFTYSNRPYFAEVQNAKIYSNSSFVFTSNKVALNDTFSHSQFGHHVNFCYDKTVVAQRNGQILFDHAGFASIEVDKGIMLCGLVSSAYGHWVPEYLTKLRFLEQHPDFESFPIIVDSDMPKSNLDFLKAITQNRILELPQSTAFNVRRLILAPTPTFYPVELFAGHNIPSKDIGPLCPVSLEYLKSKIPTINRLNPILSSKIFLSRKKMKWRRIQNEFEISDYLTSIGFQEICIEDYSFDEQVAIFANAEVIVAPNGSSLLNVIFCKKDTKIFVLSQHGLHTWAGFSGPMIQNGYHKILFVLGNEANDSKHADYCVPLERLKQALAYEFKR